MQASLELSGHPKANVQRVILSGTTLVGRSRDCGLQIASASVSRKHCEIRINGESVSVIDLGSSNGTYIDSDRLSAGEERVLQPGSRLNVGGVRFMVQYETAESATEPESQPTPAPESAAVADDAIVAEAVVADAVADEADEAQAETLSSDENVSSDEVQTVSAELAASDAAIVPDEPILLNDDDSGDVSSLPEEATLPDEVEIADDVALADDAAFTDDEPFVEDDVALAEAATGEDMTLEDDAASDEVEIAAVDSVAEASVAPEPDVDLLDPLAEPDVMDLFGNDDADDSAVAVEPPVDDLSEEDRVEDVEDEPILEADEDQAFAFLTDDEAAEEASDSQDSRLGNFLGNLGRE